MAKAGSTEKVVREIRRHTRRRFSAEEKGSPTGVQALSTLNEGRSVNPGDTLGPAVTLERSTRAQRPSDWHNSSRPSWRSQELTPEEAAREGRLPAKAFRSLLRHGHRPTIDRADELCSALGISMTIGATREEDRQDESADEAVRRDVRSTE